MPEQQRDGGEAELRAQSVGAGAPGPARRRVAAAASVEPVNVHGGATIQA